MSSSVFDAETTVAVEKWFLVGRLPGETNLRRIEIPDDGATVGRTSERADIVLPSSFISSRHARLLPKGEMLEIQDLGSRNGTFVRRERITDAEEAVSGDTVAFADVEFQLERLRKQNAVHPDGFDTFVGTDSFEGEWTVSNFAKLVQGKLVTPVMQPIVELASQRVVGIEALARSEVGGLETPARMFEAAEMLNQAALLSDICREKAIEAARGAPRGQRLFLNTHPQESLARDVLRSVQELRRRAPSLRLVIEVHEERIDELAATRSFTHRLGQMGVEFALDDFGAGRSRINEVLRLRPAFVKFDRSLIGNIDQSSELDQQAIKSLVDLMKSLSIRCVAEGIERREEANVCRRLGFELGQGFLFARPTRFDELGLSKSSFNLKEGAPDGACQRKETMDYSVLNDA
jgi:EAL domain-containing protein (putative c-di-GMP-specific phosphodiesterase class I)